MPKVPSPDELPSIEDRYRRLLKKPGISSRMKSVISNRIVEREESPMEIRHIDKTDIGELVGPIKQSNKGVSPEMQEMYPLTVGPLVPSSGYRRRR